MATELQKNSDTLVSHEYYSICSSVRVCLRDIGWDGIILSRTSSRPMYSVFFALFSLTSIIVPPKRLTVNIFYITSPADEFATESAKCIVGMGSTGRNQSMLKL